MNAITLLRNTGLTTAEIAAAVGCTYHTVMNYERGDRFPTGDRYRALVELGKSRGLLLRADDFTATAPKRQKARAA